MILETVRVWAAALRDTTLGVNAQLPSVPLDAGDSTPRDVRWVLDVTEDNAAFEGRLPGDWPGLIVSPDGNAARMDGQSATQLRDAQGVGVATEFVTGDGDLSTGLRDGFYTLRAVLRTLDDLMDQTNEASRRLNSVLVIKCDDIRMGAISVDDDEGRLILPAVFEFHVRDEAV